MERPAEFVRNQGPRPLVGEQQERQQGHPEAAKAQ
jgi:hypothetical protein